MTQRPPTRRAVASRPVRRGRVPAPPMRRTPSIRRASGGMSRVRAGAMLVVLLAGSGINGLAHSTVFAFARVDLRGAVFTPAAAVDAALADVRRQNLFELTTAPLVERLRSLPAVSGAALAVRLPDTLVVSLHERNAILVWRVGERRYLTDGDGTLFARLGDGEARAAASLPVVEDRRAASAGLSVGTRLDAVDLDAATRLASLRPADVGSVGTGLAVIVSDTNGFILTGRPAGWTAVFGFFTPSLRTPNLIPGQVRLLRSLLIGREPLTERVVLASESDGTYTARGTPRPSVRSNGSPASAAPPASATPAPPPTPGPTASASPGTTPAASP